MRDVSYTEKDPYENINSFILLLETLYTLHLCFDSHTLSIEYALR